MMVSGEPGQVVVMRGHIGTCASTVAVVDVLDRQIWVWCNACGGWLSLEGVQLIPTSGLLRALDSSWE